MKQDIPPSILQYASSVCFPSTQLVTVFCEKSQISQIYKDIFQVKISVF